MLTLRQAYDRGYASSKTNVDWDVALGRFSAKYCEPHPAEQLCELESAWCDGFDDAHEDSKPRRPAGPRKTEAQKMYNRGCSASLSSPHDLSHWDSKLGHLGDLYLVHWLDGWSDAASGEAEHYPADDHDCSAEACRKVDS